MIADDFYTQLVVAIAHYTQEKSVFEGFVEAEKAQIILDDFLNYVEKQDYDI